MIRFLQGDCRDVLKSLPDQSVQCVITSPPYFGLRDYGTVEWSGGDPDHEHDRVGARNGRGGSGSPGKNTAGAFPSTVPAASCSCGAVRTDNQIGLEASPAAYVAELVGVFREVRRVLRDDGICFINLGDSHATGTRASRKETRIEGPAVPASWAGRSQSVRVGTPIGLKTKDLMMIPARVAIALCDDGWFLRSQMPWIKRQCMPESVTDRPTNAVEYVFLLTKRASYFYDSEAIKQVGAVPAGTRAAKGSNVRSELKDVNGRPPEYWDYTGQRNFRNTDLFYESASAPWGALTNGDGEMLALDVNTMPFSAAHFATFPPKLIEPLIKAGTSERGACAACGAPWARVVEKTGEIPLTARRLGLLKAVDAKTPGRDRASITSGLGAGIGGDVPARSNRSIGWQPTCTCPPADPVPCVVLDPFSGAGTTAMVADRLGRDAIGIDLNPTYGEMARDRLIKDAGLFAEFGG